MLRDTIIVLLTLATGAMVQSTPPPLGYSGPEVTRVTECAGVPRWTTPELFADPAFVMRCNGYLFETLHRNGDGTVSPKWALGVAHNGNVSIGDPGPAARLSYVPRKALEVHGSVKLQGIQFARSEPYRAADQHVWIPIELPNGERGWLAVWRW